MYITNNVQAIACHAPTNTQLAPRAVEETDEVPPSSKFLPRDIICYDTSL